MNLWKLTAVASLVASTSAMAGYYDGLNTEETLIYQSGLQNQAYVQQGVGSDFAKGSSTIIHQDVNANKNWASVKQTADRSLIKVDQKNGMGNQVGVPGGSPFTQTGSDNQALIVQNGSFNKVVSDPSKVQGGSHNLLNISQVGNSNVATPTQNSGSYNKTYVDQKGNGNSATTSQTGGSFNYTKVTQSSTGPGAGFGASGNDNVATTSQNGSFNYIDVSQTGSSKGNGNPNGHTTVTQDGIGNAAITRQDDWGGETDVTQIGFSNVALVTQNSPSGGPAVQFSKANVTQDGIGNFAQINQAYGVVNGPVAASATISQVNSFGGVAVINQN